MEGSKRHKRNQERKKLYNWNWLQHNRRLMVKTQRQFLQSERDLSSCQHSLHRLDMYIDELRDEVGRTERWIMKAENVVFSKSRPRCWTVGKVRERRSTYLHKLAKAMEECRVLSDRRREFLFKVEDLQYFFNLRKQIYKRLKVDFRKKWLRNK